MIKYIALLVVATVFLIVGPLVAGKQGLLHIELGDYIIETSLVTAAVALVVIASVLLLVMAIIKKVLGAGKSASVWLDKRRSNKAIQDLEQSLLSYIDGNYVESYKFAQRSSECSVVPMVSAVMMAVSGIKNGDDEACNGLIKEAEKRGDLVSCHALHVLRIRGYMAKGRYEAAYALASVLYEKNSKNKMIAEVMLRCAITLNKTEQVSAILDNILKNKLLGAAETLELVGRYLTEIMHRFTDIVDLKHFWQNLPVALQEEPLMIDAAACCFSTLNDEAAATKMIVKELKRKNRTDDVYSGIASWSVGNESLLSFLEKKLTRKEESSNSLMAAVANLLLHKGEISRSRDLYIELAHNTNSKRTLLNLAAIYEAEGNYKDAAICYKKAGAIFYSAVIQK